MRRFFISLVLLFVLQAQATTLVYKSFDDLVKEADGIVIGTVATIEAQREAHTGIYTYVTLGDLEVLYGRYDRKQLTLRLEGGRVGDDVLEIVGSPVFQLNDRVLLFVKGNGSNIVPLVGWSQGMFRIQADPKSNQEVITDSDGNRVFAIESGQVIKERRMDSPVKILGPHSPDRQAHRNYSDLTAMGMARAETGEMAQASRSQAAITNQTPMRLQNFVVAIQQLAKLRQPASTPLFSAVIGGKVEAQKRGDARARSSEGATALPKAPAMESGELMLPSLTSPAEPKENQR